MKKDYQSPVVDTRTFVQNTAISYTWGEANSMSDGDNNTELKWN